MSLDDDICVNNHGGNERSVEANAAIAADKNTLRGLVLRSLQRVGPATCEEIEFRLGLKHQTASARMSELKRMEQIECVGKRPTTSGRNADVFQAATKGTS